VFVQTLQDTWSIFNFGNVADYDQNVLSVLHQDARILSIADRYSVMLLTNGKFATVQLARGLKRTRCLDFTIEEKSHIQ
jgi:hypothetical protein